tara:strand:- start:138 stop:365 length:228 start_codon:yes stop_codon:yes gene_type:complete
VSLPVDKGLRKAQICLKAGEVAEAVALYKRILSKFSKNKRALEGLKQATTVQAQGSALRVMPSQDRLNALADLCH